MRATIYVTDDDQHVCSALSRRLSRMGHLVRSFHSGEALREALDYETPDIVFLDLKMPGMDGLETLKVVKPLLPNTLILLLTAYGSIEEAVEAMRLGAYDFLIKSVDFSTLEPALHRAVEFLKIRRQLELNSQETRREFAWDQVIANSPAMTSVVTRLQALTESDAQTVFFQGEVGTGKEFLAKTLHYNSARRNGPFVSIHCKGYQDPLQNHQILGYERGALPGADRAAPGQLEHAEGGTLFLDEVEHLPHTVQETIEDVLQKRVFYRVGGHKPLSLNLLMIVASSLDLTDPANTPRFHPGLLKRLQANSLVIPPLRERKEDILPIALAKIRSYSEEIGKGILEVDPSVHTILEKYQFPGNIRELEALIEQAVLCAKDSVLRSDDFSSGTSDAIHPQLPSLTSDSQSVHLTFHLGSLSWQHIQYLIIQEVLQKTKGDKTLAAQYLQITRETLEQLLIPASPNL